MQNLRDEIIKVLKRFVLNMYKSRSLVLTLAVVVTIVTVYSLILPALTLEKDKAEEQGGIDVPVTESVEATGAEDVSDEVIPEKEEATEKTEEQEEDARKLITRKTELTSEGKDYSVSVVVDKKAELPEGTELSVDEIKENKDKQYKDLYKQAEKALRKADKDVKAKSIRFYDISLLSDGEDVEPSSDVNVKIRKGRRY